MPNLNSKLWAMGGGNFTHFPFELIIHVAMMSLPSVDETTAMWVKRCHKPSPNHRK